MSEPRDAPCPSCNGSAMVALCGRTDNFDGPCVLRGGHFGPCYGEESVASDWRPASTCRDCCVCLCGSTDDGTECPYCHITMRPGVKTTKDIATWTVVFG